MIGLSKKFLFPKNHNYLIIFEYSLLVVGWIILVATLNPTISSDGESRFRGLTKIYYHQSIPQVKFSLLLPILSLPVAYISDALAVDLRIGVAYFNFLIFTVGGIAIYRSIKLQFSYSVARSFLLILMAASMFPHHLQHYFGEVLTSMLLGYGFLNYNNLRLLSSLTLALAVINTPALIPALGIATIVQIAHKRSDRQIIFTLIIALTGIFLEIFLKYGALQANPYASVREAGYKTILPYSGLPGFSYPLFFGVLSIIFSFGKGLIFYIPGLCLIFDRCLRSRLLKVDLPWTAGTAFIICSICTYGMWWAWYGGGFWGPRFFLYLCIPASLFVAVSLDLIEKNKIKILIKFLLIFLSMWVATNGYLYGQANMNICWDNFFSQEFLCWYVPEFSALWRPFVTSFSIQTDKIYRLFFVGWQCFVFYVLVIKTINNQQNIM